MNEFIGKVYEVNVQYREKRAFYFSGNRENRNLKISSCRQVGTLQKTKKKPVADTAVV